MANGNYHGSDRSRQYGGGQSFPKKEMAPITIAGKTSAQWKPEIQNWIKKGISKETIAYSEGMGKLLTDEGLTTSQIRNVFGEMRKIQTRGFDNEIANFLLLRPKLAYAVGRMRGKGLQAFYELFKTAYDAVDTNSTTAKAQFDNLLQLMEAVLAYHKFHGGKEN